MPSNKLAPTLAATGIGIGAGAVFSWVVMMESVLRHEPSLITFGLFASPVLGQRVVSDATTPSVLLVGALVNIVLSAVFGALYERLVALQPNRSHRWERVASWGALYGLVLYLVNFQLISRLIFSWVLEQAQWPYFIAHVFVFGPVLAVMYEVAQRREQARLAHPA